jgi:hypothetical protein
MGGFMDVGMQHLHRSLAYLVILSALIGMILAVLGAGKKPGLANIMSKTHNFGLMMTGRLVYLSGFANVVLGGHLFTNHTIIAGILLWIPMEVVAKRMVKPELSVVLDGGRAGGKLMAGTAIQLLVIVATFGLMDRTF